MHDINRRIILAARPGQGVRSTDFRFDTAPMPRPADGEVLLRTLWLSIDPYLLRVVKGVPGYDPAIGPGDVMYGRGIGEVVESADPRFAPGDCVHLYQRWQTWYAANANALRKVDADRFPGSAYLGVLGQSGLTAWAGLLDGGRPRPGQTVAVSSAAGVVGSLVGQIAKITGCRAVGIAGGPEKCRHVVEDLGFDACVDYKSPRFAEELRAALPGGADVHFENVGGAVLDAMLPCMARRGRVVLCGLIAHYDDSPLVIRNSAWLLTNTLSIEAFSVFDHLHRMDECIEQLGRWILDGRLKYRETIAEGFDSAPRAMVDMFAGRVLGKQVVRVAQRAGAPAQD
ncbi:MAG: NADP-dependent oxidoreductase [Gammaproteobacteria bacterium]